VDRGRGDLARAADGVRRAGDVVARHGLALELEFNSQCEQVNTLERGRELLAAAGHPAVRLLLDTYHLHRSGATPRSVADLGPGEIGYVQYSDVPASGLEPGKAMPRLAPGRGVVPFREYFAAFAATGYAGPFSYEAPDAEAWTRPPEDVAREALAATRAVLP
jgi:sugar phosphate isomerase/epimerase